MKKIFVTRANDRSSENSGKLTPTGGKNDEISRIIREEVPEWFRCGLVRIKFDGPTPTRSESGSDSEKAGSDPESEKSIRRHWRERE